ncbi:breast cancer anti-estrogen resistance protein 1 isoform X1 [Pelodiscus sinensis]|uniref:breast cancer anti-estrogen resistance protein 1 isoform X1 n=1 Tax=Pelodiscus sinensis TaxID=13735 RepID=UPI003F6CF976
MSPQNVLAKALYDNVSESPDELSFRKGDIMTVLERNTQGLEGWWLCSLHGRQGIVPGNRLKILVGMYDKKQPAGPPPPQASLPGPPPPAARPPGDSVYLSPAPSIYPGPAPGAAYPAPPAKQPLAYPKQPPLPAGQEIYQVPPALSQAPELATSPPQEIYQVPPAVGLGQDLYQVPPSMSQPQDLYQVPPSLDVRGWDGPKPQGKVVVPTRVGQAYIYDSPKGEQDEYDIPRHLLFGPQEIYDVPPVRGLLASQVYDTPPMAVKGPTSREPGQEIYDVPPSVEKGLHLAPHTVYDVPPSVSKDVPDGLCREETYDVPPAFAKPKGLEPARRPVEPALPEDVYDVPPAAGKGAPEAPCPQEIYDVPPALRGPAQDLYDVPRELRLPAEDESVYDVPPQVDRETRAGEAKRLSASSTGSARSNVSSSSLDAGPGKEAPKELGLDLDAAMELLARLQHHVSSSVSYLMSFAGRRGPEQLELRAAAEGVQVALRDLLEFARGAVGSAAQASDRALHAKLSKQLQKMEEAHQALLRHSQALEGCGWAPSADDLDRLVMSARGVPDDAKQLASFLHGNASLLFRRGRPPAEGPDASPPLASHPPAAPADKASSIQSRPLPSPPKFLAQESPDGQYESSEGGWMEDYDYVHLQGKEEFEKTQKELLEKGNIIRQGKGQLEQQQLKQFERLEQEVTRPIDNDLSSWAPPQPYAQVRGGSALGPSDRQLLLFYLEQCEAGLAALTSAVDAFLAAVGANQPPKIFVAHSKFVILSAHKLVFIGDTLARQARAPDVRHRVTQHSNRLCDLLKELVGSTKAAALHYPSPAAARDMLERVRELAGGTQQFHMALGQLAAM